MNMFVRSMRLMLPTVLTISGAVGLIYSKQPKPSFIQQEMHTDSFQRAFFEAAKVYGRAGCGDQQLTEMTARYSISSELPPQLIAAMVSTESNCNPQAVSNRGALGLMQVVPKQWNKKFDFSKINLLNSEDNMTVGTSILSNLTKQYGTRNGLLRYYGMGSDGVGLTGVGYADRVLQLAGRP